MFGCDATRSFVHGDSQEASGLSRTLEFLACVFYCSVHILVLYAQIVTLNVAMNSSRGVVMVVLTSSNINELKAAVLKRFSETNTFQIVAADIVERFQTIVIMTVIAVNNLGQIDANDSVEWLCDAFKMIVAVLLLESVVDCVKHGFITQFNNIDPAVFTKFGTLLCHDVVLAPENIDFVAYRIGLVPLPIGVIVCSGVCAWLFCSLNN